MSIAFAPFKGEDHQHPALFCEIHLAAILKGRTPFQDGAWGIRHHKIQSHKIWDIENSLGHRSRGHKDRRCDP